MHRILIIFSASALFLGGCFDITEPEGFRCSEAFSECPDDQECLSGFCRPRGWKPEAGVDMKEPDLGKADARPDAPKGKDLKSDGPGTDLPLKDGPTPDKAKDGPAQDKTTDGPVPDQPPVKLDGKGPDRPSSSRTRRSSWTRTSPRTRPRPRTRAPSH